MIFHIPSYRVSSTQRRKHDLLYVPCGFCYTFHIHGVGEGHRGAHCTNKESVYKKSGYDLIVVGDFTPAIEKQFKDKWRKHKRSNKRTMVTKAQVREIRSIGITQAIKTKEQLALKYGLEPSDIWDIIWTGQGAADHPLSRRGKVWEEKWE